jgi:CMP-N-acetylneuraminic acid synthetase
MDMEDNLNKTYNDMTNLAIIPARGGSKRIPRKNIKLFSGKPIISYSVEAALKTQLFDEVMVSTDDAEIAEVARQYGASVPFLRSEATANGFCYACRCIICKKYNKFVLTQNSISGFYRIDRKN